MPPEVRVLVIAFNPATYDAIEVARVARAEFTDENVVGAILEALDMAADAIGAEDLALWQPQVDLWLWSDTATRAAIPSFGDPVRSIFALGIGREGSRV